MALRASDWIAYGLLAACLVAGVWYCADRASQRTSTVESVDDHVRHADMYYWFAMMGRGSLAAIRGGEAQAAKAEKALADTDLDDAERARLRKRIEGIRTDLAYQRRLYENTFHGVFPWGHFMAKPTLFRDPRATGSFELLDPPWEIASRQAVNDLVDSVLAAQTVVAQHDVVFVTDPADFPDDPEIATQLENEALYLFNRNPRFFVHNRLEVATTLGEDEFAALRRLEPSAKTLATLREGWGHRDILVVRMKKNDETNFHHFYTAQGRLFRGTTPEPAAIYNNFGFCRDRRHMLVPVLVLNGLMLVAAVLLFRLLGHIGSLDRRPPSWGDAIGLGAMAFVWGRLSVWGLVELVEGFVPEDETLAILSFWWPAVTGLVVILGPGLVLRFAEERFGWLEHRFATFNRGGALAVACVLGSTTYVAQAALWVRGWNGWQMLLPLYLGAILAGWIVGRALDTTDPVRGLGAWLVAAFVLLLGPAFSNSRPSSLWMAALPIVATSGVVLVRTGRHLRPGERTATTPSGDAPPPAGPDSVPALLEAAQSPPYRATASWAETEGRLAAWREERVVRCQFVGPPGVGKSALLRELCRRVAAAGASVLHGECREPSDGSVSEPYFVFAEAIAGHFSVNLLRASGNVAGIDRAIDGIFEEVVPFSDLLFPPSSGESASCGSRAELFRSIAVLLRELARRRPVVLVVDDAHWIDDGSRELLAYLLAEFPAGGSLPVALLAAGREPLPEFAAAEVQRLSPLGGEEVIALLTEGLSFAPEPARALADSVGEEAGNLHWLFRMVGCLARRGVIERTDRGFAWPEGTRLDDVLPDDFRDSLLADLAAHPEFRPVLECAACIGSEFRLEVLSRAVGLPRMECVHLLDGIEERTGLVRDTQRDETYRFRSPFVLQSLRVVLGVNAHGPATPGPQRIREHHAQLFDAWEATLAESTAAVYRVANHGYASGVRHAGRATRAALDAARTASAQYHHARARDYIAMARECAAAAGARGEDVEREALLVACHEAHVDGRGRVEAAERALAWWNDHPEADHVACVAVARACYDAGIDTRDPVHFANCTDVARRIVERFDAPPERAEGLHFLALGLPPAERDARRGHLEEALALTEAAERDGEGDTAIEAARSRARIANSLAEQLAYGSDEDRARARELFELSIAIKWRPATRDVEGLARAHGGLGRLAFFAPRPEYDLARHHFEQDLRYAERIGSGTGITKMHSLLGACDLRQNDDATAALAHYETAREHADERVDLCFALAGLLECHARLDDADRAGECGRELLALAEAHPDADGRPALPEVCHDAVRTALAAGAASDDWHVRVSELVDAT